MEKLANLKELASIVKTNLRSINSIILGEEKRKKRILSAVFLFAIFFVSAEISLISVFYILHVSNNEILIFKSIINMQLILTAIWMLIKIMNVFYLASDFKEMMVYPIKAGNLLLSKCILCYFSSMLISIIVLVLLFSYGILAGAGIAYYLNVILYEIIITAVPTLYIVLISLTVFWVMTVFRKSESKYESNKWLILIDLAVIILTYVLLKLALSNHGKIGSILFNIFFGREKLIEFIIALSIIIISCIGFYFTIGNVYLTIMKSGLFKSRDCKDVELDSSQYEFKMRNTVISNIIRDAKLIMRVPVLRFNCITVNVIFSITVMIVLIIFRKQVIICMSLDNAYGIKSYFVIALLLTLKIGNGTCITAFSREGRALNQLKVFPLTAKKVLLSKICISMLGNVLPIISTNVFIVLISSNFAEFILLEIVTIIYITGISIIEIEMDIDSMELKWTDIKNLFYGHYFKILKPYFILTLLPMIYVVVVRLLRIKLTEYLTAGFMIFIMFIYAWSYFRKIIKRLSQKYYL